METVKENMRYGSVKKGDIYRRGVLEEYVEKYRCMLIEAGATRGILSCDYNDDYLVRDVIESAGGNFRVGHTVVSNKYFEQVIIVERI